MRKSVFVPLIYLCMSFSLNHWKIMFLEILFHLISYYIMFSVATNLLLSLFLVSMILCFMLVVLWTNNCLWRESGRSIMLWPQLKFIYASFHLPHLDENLICKRNIQSDIFPVSNFSIRKYTAYSSGTSFLLTGLLSGSPEKKWMLECSNATAYYISWYRGLYSIKCFTSKVSFIRNCST